tara:strand:- start:2440 stop:2643 length:204 start_codon:yes stop_codon:yes gene_type:complete
MTKNSLFTIASVTDFRKKSKNPPQPLFYPNSSRKKESEALPGGIKKGCPTGQPFNAIYKFWGLLLFQ